MKAKIKSGRVPGHVVAMLALSVACAILLGLWQPTPAIARAYADDSAAVEKADAVEAVHGLEAGYMADVRSIRADGSDQLLPADSGKTITVTADGVSTVVELYSGTVSDALAKAGVTLSETDECFPATNVLLTNGMTVSVSRVTYDEITTTEAVAYQTVRQNDNTLEKGKTKVQQAGQNGVRTIVTRVRRIDGEVVSQEVLRDEITTQPVDRIILVGTKPVYGPYHGMTVTVNAQTGIVDLATQAALIGTGSRPGSASWRATINGDGTIIDPFGNTVSYQSMISGRATAYYAPPGAGTSTGRKASYGVVAVDPKIIPYGTKLFICSADGSIVYGYAIAGDTGGTLLKGTVLVDLYYNNYDQCVWFGSKKMNVYILN